jgi:hypothetical protein
VTASAIEIWQSVNRQSVIAVSLIFEANDERMHHYQRRRESITV